MFIKRLHKFFLLSEECTPIIGKNGLQAGYWSLVITKFSNKYCREEAQMGYKLL
jgi:hypothetical protein